MKFLLIIILSIMLSTCATQRKDIQVRKEQWTLIDKDHASREGDNYFVWLIWQNESGITYRERVRQEEEGVYWIGMKIENRI